MATNNPKRDHHILPELYLKGFVTEKNKPFIWVYKRGEEYNPGRGKITNNPYSDSVRRVTVVRDFYADRRGENQRDFETFENKLEQLEKPADRIFEKLRSRHDITGQEKHKFSIYIEMMRRRVRAGRETVTAMLPNFPVVYKPTDELFEKLRLPKTQEARAFLKQETERLVQREGYGQQMHVRISASAEDSILIEVLNKMTWHFFVAPQGHAFLTSDNPVFIPRRYGLRMNVSELSFPISTEVALVASWTKQSKARFNTAKPCLVKDINRRTAANASQYAYFSENKKWVLKLLERTSCDFSPTFPARSIYPVV